MKKKNKFILGAVAAGAIGAAIYMICKKKGSCCDGDVDKTWKKAKRHATNVFSKAKEAATEGWPSSSEPNK